MVHFVGAGSGAADLITVRGKRLLEQADVHLEAVAGIYARQLSLREKQAQMPL